MLESIFYWLNSSFSPLTFLKLRFWLSKKKTTKPPPKFGTCDNFGPKANFDSVYADMTPLMRCHVLFFLFFLPWGAKTATIAKFRGQFYNFFLRRPKSQLRES